MSNNKLRPTKLDDIIGQKSVKKKLGIIIKAAKNRDSTIPHILFYGPSGTGKSTLSLAVANEIDSDLHSLNAGNITSPKDILPAIFRLKKNDVLFVDEIHRLNTKTCEMLYTIMEDFTYCSGDDGITMNVPKFTMIGATTEAGTLPRPMYDRFVYKMELKLYNNDDLAQIIKWNAEQYSLQITADAAINLAKRSRGTPRVANNMVTWVRDYVNAKGSSIVSDAVAEEAARMMGIDVNGSTEADRAYIKALKKLGRPSGIKTIIDASGIDEETIVNIIEPFLLKNGIIARTSKGRILT
jgi:Holliday junction DNA helicase RuvB